ncbi:SWI/SNF-related matrix-associated actin-dependent regulator of chromatin subfamily A-like protein 1 [Oopsacas minuta]|uniref:SWI/SNF-related matrix-associated actin-dependent regulator of chromatin subfamily A-like protein 1 n=1 Tax=Oopsacas minuta TaxID=111878 RepID=A0AAV7JIY7_9METZ|nr:SWI/SNF-related matrix-associated actin-dependent regulator of chromatin subfamily A-like protein 1 [Oopsacas minuta]
MSFLITHRIKNISTFISKMFGQLKRGEENRKRTLELKSKSIYTSTSNTNKQTFAGKYKQFGGTQTSSIVFSLKDENQFIVEAKFNENLIETFKVSPVWSYDPLTKAWVFPLEYYKQLTSRIEKNCPGLTIEHIPSTIFTILKEKYNDNLSIDSTDIPNELRTSLLPYQVEGVKFCIARNGRAIIADEMGLGKTIQAIAVACYFQLKWPLLIMCPSSLRLGWKEQLIKWVPWLEDDSIHIPFSTAEISTNLMSQPVTILSYDLVVKLTNIKMKTDIWKYSILIADESHFLKNAKSARTKAALPLLKQADHVLLLTGTPALSRPMELYPQITAVDKQLKMSNYQFAKRYCDAKETPWGWDYSGASRLAELQIYLNKRVMIRRSKCEVLQSLPSKTRKTVQLKLEEIKIKELKQNVSELSNKSNGDRYGCMLELFAKTAQAKAQSVCEYLIKLIEDSVELENEELSDSNGEDEEILVKHKPLKIIVFFHHKCMLAELEKALTSHKIGYMKIEGATAPLARQSACDLFQHGEAASCRIALLSLKAAGTGLTLTAAKIVLFAELFWNPGDLRQAEDRAHRLGQDQDVEIQYLVGKGTIDDKIWPLLQRKLEVLSQAGLANNTKTDSFATSSVLNELFNSQENAITTSQTQQRSMTDFIVSSPKRLKTEIEDTTLGELENLDTEQVNDLLDGDWSD